MFYHVGLIAWWTLFHFTRNEKLDFLFTFLVKLTGDLFMQVPGETFFQGAEKLLFVDEVWGMIRQWAAKWNEDIHVLLK